MTGLSTWIFETVRLASPARSVVMHVKIEATLMPVGIPKITNKINVSDPQKRNMHEPSFFFGQRQVDEIGCVPDAGVVSCLLGSDSHSICPYAMSKPSKHAQGE